MSEKTSPQPEYIICHYAEIGLKGKNREYFERKLKDNIKYAIRGIEPGLLHKTKRIQGRILLHLSETGRGKLNEILDRIGKVFGVAYYAPAYRIDQDLDEIKEFAHSLIKRRAFTTFRITTRRTDPNFPYSAHRMNEMVGAFIVDKLDKKVKLKGADLDCRIDLFYQNAFIYLDRYEGLGGLPVGASGKAALMLSGGIDSPVAGYYTLKRGVQLVAIHFHSMPYTTETALEKVRGLIKKLVVFQGRIKVILVALTPIQQEILVKTDEKYRVILYRRFMLRIAQKLADREGIKALVTGESLGQVASQTIENLAVIEESVKIPVLRPLIGMDKQEIISVAQKINTYELSIQPHLDCCTLFVPKHPATKARLKDVVFNEEKLAVDGLIEEAVETASEEVIDV